MKFNLPYLRLLILLAATNIFAMTMSAYTVTGRFIEADTNDACVGANYNLYFQNDTLHTIFSGFADIDGRFSFTLNSPGTYLLKSRYTDFKPVNCYFEITDSMLSINLGDIIFQNSYKKLDEVEILGRRALIQSDGGKLTYDVERDEASGNSTVMEMLRRVPMVTVDGDDNIKIKGQSNFKIYVNGKPDPMLSGDPKAVLKAMPASSIKKIEVITDPGAKYEADGIGGILNIITIQKQTLEGYSGNVRGGLSSSGYNGSLYARTKIRNVTAAARINGYNGAVLRAHDRSMSERENLTDDQNHFYRSSNKSINKFNYWMAGFDMSWELDTLNLFTFSVSYRQQASKSSTSQFLSMNSIDEILQWSYERHYKTHGKRSGLSTNLSYQHTFPGNSMHTLTFTFQFDNGNSPQHNSQHTSNYIDFTGQYEPYRNHLTHTHYNFYTLQTDYVLPLFHNKHTLETGCKIVMRPTKEKENTSSSDDGNDYTQDSYISLTQNNDVFAAYLSYNASLWRFSLRAGLRYEHSSLGIDYHRLLNVGDFTDFSQNLNDLVPNASVSYNFPSGANIRAAYSNRIRRPSVNQLNPFVNNMTFGEIDYGNPSLTSEQLHNFEFKYSNYGGKLGGEISVDYSRCNNSIESIEFIEEGILHSTFGNIGNHQMFQIGTYGEYQFSTAMNIGAWIGCSYEDYKAKNLLNTRSHGWQASVSINYHYTLPWRLQLDAWGGAWSPWRDLQSKSNKGDYYYGLNIGRSFLKENKLRLSINAQNFLQSKKSHGYRTVTEKSITNSTYTYRCWSIGFSLTYNFGKLRQDVKRTRASVNNDDVNTGDSNGNKK